MKTEGEIKQRIERLSGEQGKIFDDEAGCYHDDRDRELRRMELRWVLHGRV